MNITPPIYHGTGYNQLNAQQQTILAQQMSARNYGNMMANSNIQISFSKWTFNGKNCTVREMANQIWPIDCSDKTHFLLKYE